MFCGQVLSQKNDKFKIKTVKIDAQLDNNDFIHLIFPLEWNIGRPLQCD